MKKLLFAFIATVMLSGVSFGQESINLEDYSNYHNKSLDAILTDIHTNKDTYLGSKDPRGVALSFYIDYANKNFPSSWANSEKESFLKNSIHSIIKKLTSFII